MTSIFEKLPKETVKGMKLYRLGVFEKSSFDFIELSDSESYPEHYHKNSEAKLFVILAKEK